MIPDKNGLSILLTYVDTKLCPTNQSERIMHKHGQEHMRDIKCFMFTLGWKSRGLVISG